MRRLVLASFFSFALVLGYRASAPQLEGIRTEEGQLVAFPGGTFLQRELSKKLPLEEPWPNGPVTTALQQRFSLTAPPRSLAMPSRIAGDVYLVGQSDLSNLTYMIDCGPDGVALIDPTYDSEVENTLANVEKCGRARKDVRWVINTHCHTDHSWADHKFRELGAQIIIHQADADAIEKGTQVTAFLRYNLKEFPRCPIDRRLSDGEILRLGNKSFQVIHTPGHTPGSACFLLETEGRNLLFSGDTVLYDSMLGWQQNPYADNAVYLRSVEKLEHFMIGTDPVRWDMLLPGHGAIALDHAWLDVQKARERIQYTLASGRDIFFPPYPDPEYRRKMFGRPAVSSGGQR